MFFQNISSYCSVKFLLAAGEPDSPGKPMRIPTLNKRLSTSLTQEALEQLYERLMRIINLPVDEYLENEEYAKDIEASNKKSITAKSDKQSLLRIQDREKNDNQGATGNGVNEQITENKGDMEIEEEPKFEAEQDDLICDEVIFRNNNMRSNFF